MSASPDRIRVATPENVSLGYVTAGVGSRTVAQVIDNLCAGVVVFIGLLGYSALASTASTLQGTIWALGGAVAFASFVYFGYFFVSEAASGGRTLGKSALGLRVLRLDGSAPDAAAFAIRNIVRLLDLTGLGLLVMFFHPLSRRLGDLAAGTVVVRERAPVSLAAAAAPPPLLLRTPDPGPAIDNIHLLGAPELEALRAFLTRQGLATEQRQRLAAQLASRLCDRLQLPPNAPERSWPSELLLERAFLQLDSRAR